MKLRSTTPTVSKSFVEQSALVAMSVLVAAAGIFSIGSAVFAVDYDSQIREKERQAEQYNNEADRLGAVAATIEEAVGQLNNQISDIQAQINESQKKHDDLVAEIARNEKLIENNRVALGEILSDIYVDDQISPLEMLASSSNIGDYIDKQEQRSTLRESLNDKIKDIKALQNQLEEDKKLVENVLKDQESQRNQLASKQAEQEQLLSQTKNDQNNYSKLAAERNAEIERLRAAQAAENLRRMQAAGWGGSSIPAPSPGNGGYPAKWANAPIDAYVDNWGLYTRECVSYVAWKIANSGRYVPHFGGAGHAYQWPSTTAKFGIPSGSTPKAGSAAVQYGGPYGHVMYVESVNADGTITVSDYNLGVDGLYRYYTRSASGLTYIYF